MSIAPGYTDDEVRWTVYEYVRQPWGTRQAWLAEQGVSRQQLRRWSDAVFDGHLDRGLIPREGSDMTTASQRRQIAIEQSARDIENEHLRARVHQLEATNEALGKAIGLLHQLNAQEPDPPQTNEPSSS